jgi:hypothetical protein
MLFGSIAVGGTRYDDAGHGVEVRRLARRRCNAGADTTLMSRAGLMRLLSRRQLASSAQQSW